MNKKFMSIILIAFLVIAGTGCKPTNKEETEIDVEQENNQEEETDVEETEGNEDVPKVVSLENDDLAVIGEKLHEEVDGIYLAKTEEEYYSVIESTFVDVEHYGEAIKSGYEPNKYKEINVIRENEEVERINENTFTYQTDYQRTGITVDGNEESMAEGTVILEIIYLEDEDTFKILVVRTI